MIRSCINTLLAPIIVSICFLLLAGGPASASPGPRAALENTVNQVLQELKKPELKNPATRDAVLQNVERIIVGLFSFEELSMRTVGPSWRNCTTDQKKRFMDAFEDLLRERYLAALLGYNGESVDYLKETPVGNAGDKVQIDTQVNMKDKPVPMSYRMLKKNGWVVYDIIIEGVSLVQNYRSQFQAVLQRGDTEELITLVRQKAEETKARNNK